MAELTDQAKEQLQAEIDKLAEELAQGHEALGLEGEQIPGEILEVKRLQDEVLVDGGWLADAQADPEIAAKIDALLDRIAKGPYYSGEQTKELENYEPSPEELARAARLAQRELAQRLIQWASIKESLEHVEGLITEAILALGETVVVGDVKAAYYKPGLTVHYQEGAEAHSEDKGYKQAVKANTTARESIGWAKVCQAMGLEPEDLPSTPRPARVVISWVS